MQMTLATYLNGPGNFHRYDARLPHGGKITAHHNRDTSTEKYYATMNKYQFLVTYVSRSGEVVRLSIVDGAETVICTPTR